MDIRRKEPKHIPTLKELVSRGDLIRADELAYGMKVSQGTVYQWVRRGLIPFLQIEKCIRFESQEIDKWLESKRWRFDYIFNTRKGKSMSDLFDLVNHWEDIARRKWTDSEAEEDPMGKKLIEHGALCYQNCAYELKRALISSLPLASTIQGEG